MPTIVSIPGGTATLADPDEMTVRRRRPIQVLAASMDRLSEITANAPGVDEAQRIASLHLTEAEIDQMSRLQDAVVLAFLLGWTLDLPLPETLEDVGDMPVGVYDALSEHTAKLGARLAADETFSPAGAGDPESPTGASDA
ncbi:MAG: hypothetical protein ACYCV4_02080 [Dermatophilaceae bacterium]